MINERKKMYWIRTSLSLFLVAITLLSFPPSVFLLLLSQVQEHELSYDLIPFSPLLLFLRLLLFFYFHVVFSLSGEKQG